MSNNGNPQNGKSQNQKKKAHCSINLDQIQDSYTMEQDVRKDLMKVEIFFQSMTTSIINEEPKYSVSLFCSLCWAL